MTKLSHNQVADKVEQKLQRRGKIPHHLGFERMEGRRPTMRVTPDDKHQLGCFTANVLSDNGRYGFSIYKKRHTDILSALPKTSWIAFGCGSIDHVLLFDWEYFAERLLPHAYPPDVSSYADGEQQVYIDPNFNFRPPEGEVSIDVSEHLI